VGTNGDWTRPGHGRRDVTIGGTIDNAYNFGEVFMRAAEAIIRSMDDNPEQWAIMGVGNSGLINTLCQVSVCVNGGIFNYDTDPGTFSFLEKIRFHFAYKRWNHRGILFRLNKRDGVLWKGKWF
jgi:hypothetical protein